MPTLPAASGLRGALSGDVLSAATVRRLAYDAGIVPLVLGRRGEPLDIGREQRLVTRGLRVALIASDQGAPTPAAPSHPNGPTRTTSPTGPPVEVIAGHR